VSTSSSTPTLQKERWQIGHKGEKACSDKMNVTCLSAKYILSMSIENQLNVHVMG
jgi:hypothetical protein